MRSHAKAPTAGSSRSSRGGHPGPHGRLAVAVLACVLGLLALAPSAGASKAVSTFFGNLSGQTGVLGGQLTTPRGVAVSNASGDIYVADWNNDRVSHFDSAHGFVSAWGWDVVASGPGDSAASEQQRVTVKGNGGTFRLRFNGVLAVSLPFDASAAQVQSALNQLATIGGVGGSVTVTGGPGDEAGTSPYVVTFGGALGGDELPAMTAAQQLTGPGKGVTIATLANGGGFEICKSASGDTCKGGLSSISPVPGGELNEPEGIAVDQTTGNVYVTNSGFLRVDVFDSVGNFIRAFGKDVVQTGKPGNTGTGTEVCTVAADCKTGVTGALGGEFGSSFTGHPAVAPATAPNAGNVLVADPANQRVQEFTSGGAFVRTFGFDVAGAGAGADNTGTGFEVCAQAIAGAANCKAGTPGSEPGQFEAGAVRQMAVDSTGAIYTVENQGNFRVQKLTPQVGPPVLSPAVFAPALLSTGNSLNGIAIGPADRVLVVKNFDPGATPSCPFTGVPSGREDRVLEVKADGSELLDTHMTCTGVPFQAGQGILVQRGLAVDPVRDLIYVSSQSGALEPENVSRVYVLDDVALPTAILDPVTDFDSFGATFEGEVDPNGTRTDYRFEYSSDGGATWTCLIDPSCTSLANLIDAGSGTAPVEASAHADLLPGESYLVRLVAVKPFGAGAATSANQGFATPAVPPTTITGPVAPRTLTTARLHGLVNPNNFSTEVHFEYGTAGPCSANPCTSTASQGVGSEYVTVGKPFQRIVTELTGLAAGTTYHYRLVANSSAGTAAGEDRSFVTRTLAEATPPERGIELVNNPDKGNQNVLPLVRAQYDSAMTVDGNRVLWSVRNGAPGSHTGAGDAFLAQRTATGWRSRTLIPPPDHQFGGGLFAYSITAATPEFSTFLFGSGQKSVTGTVGPGPLLRIGLDQHEEVLAPEWKTAGGQLSADGEHVLLRDPGTSRLMDIAGGGEFLDVMPDSSPSECGVTVVGLAPDASRVYFQARPNGECGSGTAGLYVRDREAQETTLIDPGAAGKAPEQITVAPDGRSAHFASFGKLEPADGNEHADIYRWSEAGGAACLTCAVPGAEVAGAPLTDFLVSADSSHVYFQSRNQLLPGRGEAGDLNVYALSGGDVNFVANPDVQSGGLSRGRTARLSSDGDVFVFSSFEAKNKDLTADEIAPVCPSAEADEAGACRELYLYDDRDGGLECVSCRRDGETTHNFGALAVGDARLDGGFGLSADGSTVVFPTAEALVPADINGDVDLYEWRDGALGLVTDGATDFPEGLSGPPNVAGVTPDGSDILFAATAPRLTGFERDGLANLYDARIGGGFVPPDPPVPCDGEACNGPLQAPPPQAPPASASFSGHGNAKAPPRRGQRRCGRLRGKAKRRCIQKRKRQAQAARAHRNQGRNK